MEAANRYDNLRSRLERRVIPSLNGLRAIAVTAVVADHAGLPLPFLRGGHGVMLFFVLSGFLITWLLLQEHARQGSISLWNFYVRRSLRILPLCYIYVAFVVSILLLVGSPVAWEHVTSSLFHYSNYQYALSRDVTGWLQHLWTLAVEEQFYLFWPGVFVVLWRKPSRVAPFLLVAIPCVWIIRVLLAVAGVADRYIYRAFEARADQLLVGCLMAVLIHRGLYTGFWRALCRWPAMLICLVALQLSAHLDHVYPYFYRFAVGSALEPILLAALLIQSVVLGDKFLDVLPFRYLGRISYGLYVFHELGAAVAARLVHGSAWLALLVSFAVTFVISVFSFHFFEEPLLRLKSKFQRLEVDTRA